MENPWDDIGDLQPEMENPINIVKELFTPIYEKTNEKVIYKLDQVNFFPEEVRYTHLSDIKKSFAAMTSVGISNTLLDDLVRKEPHPDFGYDPNKTHAKEYFRYRMLLSPVINETIEFELFKFKFSLLFCYPVQFFIDHSRFKGLSGFVDETSKFVIANTEEDLYVIISTIIRSDSTIKLIKRLMAL
ncbi:MAG: hypothetical protein D3913_01185 [Candidatus Electrothrix sp. LOE1_4_5]|nr:hypothetical protein [Candidatus Electrothrix gigas]